MISRRNEKIRVLERYKRKLQDAINERDQVKVNRYRSLVETISKELHSTPSTLGQGPGPYWGRVQAIKTALPNISDEKALMMARQSGPCRRLEVGDNFGDEFIFSIKEMRENSMGSEMSNNAFKEAEREVMSYSDGGDFSNDIAREHQMIVKRLQKLETDFTNHMEDYHGVSSIDNAVMDFKLDDNISVVHLKDPRADFDYSHCVDEWGEEKLYQEFTNDCLVDQKTGRKMLMPPTAQKNLSIKSQGPIKRSEILERVSGMAKGIMKLFIK